MVGLPGFLVDDGGIKHLKRCMLMCPSQSMGLLNLTFSFGKEGQVIISLPASCLLTTDTVIRSYLGAYIAK